MENKFYVDFEGWVACYNVDGIEAKDYIAKLFYEFLEEKVEEGEIEGFGFAITDVDEEL